MCGEFFENYFLVKRFFRRKIYFSQPKNKTENGRTRLKNKGGPNWRKPRVVWIDGKLLGGPCPSAYEIFAAGGRKLFSFCAVLIFVLEFLNFSFWINIVKIVRSEVLKIPIDFCGFWFFSFNFRDTRNARICPTSVWSSKRVVKQTSRLGGNFCGV
jgi:hypothetical protein